MSEEATVERAFEGRVRRGHAVEPGHVVLLLEHYAGGIEVGDEIVVAHAGGTARGRVVTLAWGSAFGAEDPPLTLVVSGLSPASSYDGATVGPAPVGT